MVEAICRATFCTYPGGGCWGVRTEGFELGDFDMVQILSLQTVLDTELEELAADAGPKGIEFIRRLRATPGMGSYIMLNRNGFTFSMDNHRKASNINFKQFGEQVFRAFCEVYRFSEMSFT